MKRKLMWLIIIIFAIICIVPLVGLWTASNQLLFPVWRGVTKDLADCKEETAKYWGKGCGNLRITHEFKFAEVKIPTKDGYELPSWFIGVSENGMGTPKGVILLIHGGGSDRREVTRYIRFYLGRNLDVLTLELACHGEAPCLKSGLTYGERESRDVLSAYLYLASKYEKIYAMGSSVGAASILIALPEMPKLSVAIVENPMYSFERLIREFPETKDSVPSWFNTLLIRLTMLRAGFDGTKSAAKSLPLVKNTAIFFIHSKKDNIVPFQHTQELSELYSGTKTVWVSEKGNHGTIWDADKDEYEKRLGGFLNSVQ